MLPSCASGHLNPEGSLIVGPRPARLLVRVLPGSAWVCLGLPGVGLGALQLGRGGPPLLPRSGTFKTSDGPNLTRTLSRPDPRIDCRRPASQE